MRIERRVLFVAGAAVAAGAVCFACYQAGYQRGQQVSTGAVATFHRSAGQADY